MCVFIAHEGTNESLARGLDSMKHESLKPCRPLSVTCNIHPLCQNTFHYISEDSKPRDNLRFQIKHDLVGL